MGFRDLFRRDRDGEQHSAFESEPTVSGIVSSAAARWDAPNPASGAAAPARGRIEGDRPGAHLAEGGSVSVSNEEHYQGALAALRGADRGGIPTRATLVVNEAGNPWSTKPTGPVLEVRVGTSTVGFLTSAMSERYLPFARSARAEGRSLNATALVVDGSGKGGRDVEITLNALPIWQDQTSIAGMNIATTPEFILFHRTGRAHVIGSDIDGGWLTACGERLSEGDAVLVLKTTPWVGRVRADGSLHANSPWWCGRCVPDDTDGPLEEGGRFGEQTDISRDYRFSSDMTAKAVNEALATRLFFDVAGESYRPGYPDNLLQLAEVLRTMDGREWLAAVLRRDPNNEYDRCAIEVHVPGSSGHCGFVPGQLAKILAPILDSGAVISASAVEVRIHPESPNKPGLTIVLTLATPFTEADSEAGSVRGAQRTAHRC